MATRKTEGSTGRSSTTKGSSASAGSNGSSNGTGRSPAAKRSTAKSAASTTAAAGGRRPARRTSEASAAGATARARISAARRAGRGSSRPKEARPDLSIAEPTVTATDEALASNAQKALNSDMPRVAWLRTQLQNLEAQRAERLVKVAQLTLIAIVFITFVLQNATGVNVHFLLFALNIRLIWVIFGCGLLGGVAGYLIGRPEKSLRAMFPEKKKPARNRG